MPVGPNSPPGSPRRSETSFTAEASSVPEQVAEAQPCPTLPADSLEPSRKRARTRPEGSSSAAGLQSPQSSGVRAASPGQTQARSPLRPAARSPETSAAGAGTSAQGSLSSGAKIRHELQALPPAARLEQHDHANGVLPAQDFLRCLFDLHSTAPATSNLPWRVFSPPWAKG